jgi:hypothetical protein
MGPIDLSQQVAARLRDLFRDVNPPEITGIDLRGQIPQEIIQLLPKYGGKNPVYGILVDEATGRAYGLRSGWSLGASTFNGIPFQKGNISNQVAAAAGGPWKDLGNHVEAQAAAFMRKSGITEASLYINSGNPCYQGGTGCYFRLAEMLAEGSRLKVFNKNVKLFLFTGIQDQ